jgi:T-complex protein 1 subunit eta
VHPAARILTDIARSQDAEVGDGTTSVVVLAGEILKEVRDLVEQGVSSQTIIKGLRRASAMAVNKVKEIAVEMINSAESEEKKIETLRRLAGTAMNSKLIKRNQEFFTKSKPWAGSVDLGVEIADEILPLQWLSMRCLPWTRTI